MLRDRDQDSSGRTAAAPVPHPWREVGYDTKARFGSYWHQLDAIRRGSPRTVLEVGTGSGIVAALLRHRSIDVTTVDTDPALMPDGVARVEALPFPESRFDAVVCCQVLEHIPYSDVPAALAELGRVSRRHVVISVPDITPCVRLLIPRLGKVERPVLLRQWWRRLPRGPLNPAEHHWELGTRPLPAGRFQSLLENNGFRTLREYRVFENPYHHFFELELTDQRAQPSTGPRQSQ